MENICISVEENKRRVPGTKDEDEAAYLSSIGTDSDFNGLTVDVSVPRSQPEEYLPARTPEK